MRKRYDLSKSRRNPYAKRLKAPVTIRLDPEVLTRFLRMIKDTVPQADQRAPETVLDEVLTECENALKAKYSLDAEP